jgi:hypothetical protein
MTASVFNIRELALNDEQVGSLNEMAAKRKRREGKAAPPARDKKERVVVVPLSWRQRLKGRKHWATWDVAHHLFHLDWKAGGRPFKVTSIGLTKWGVSRGAKLVVLDRLEASGLIRVEGKEGKSPMVTILVR